MQNNVTEITQKLLGALDGDYNVTNMATIIEVITLLEKSTITKEMLETTRLGKHVNEMRKHISNDTLARRAKLLVKKWRAFLNPNEAPNNTTQNVNTSIVTTNGQVRRNAMVVVVPEDCSKKRPSSRLEGPHGKKQRANGGLSSTPFDYDFSDNSNSSFKDVHVPIVPTQVVVVNSDSNSSTQDAVLHDQGSTTFEEQPKKRGRKKGSKNHKNLIEEAESSFSNKMAVSRGNAKVKTTQELIESLQNRSHTTPAAPLTSPANNIEDWRERAAKLTERVSLIDQKLNSGHRLKKHRSGSNNNKDGLALTTTPSRKFGSNMEFSEMPSEDDDEIIVVDDVPSGKQELSPHADDFIPDTTETTQVQVTPSLSVEEALNRLPPIDTSKLYSAEEEDDSCLCILEDGNTEEDIMKFRVHDLCPARQHLDEKYRLNDVSDERVALLHSSCIDNLNGNFSCVAKVTQKDTDAESSSCEKDRSKDLAYVNIVPNFFHLPAKEACSENYKKYSISENVERGREREEHSGDSGLVEFDNNSNNSSDSCKLKKPKPEAETIFREFHECCERPSYNGDTLRILPYVIID